ncbi:MAG: hypothetical protein SGJ27_21055 [Candidatus Melainabacteria bacterium]|nr:hypothetical protein [Candidatus Melainabacteria bacterium]
MGILPAFFFYGLLSTFILSFLLTLFNDEMRDFFYMIFDSIVHQLSNIIGVARR